eukprot:scaffold322159_cov18-Tisochrysis_lutea.AAC.2
MGSFLSAAREEPSWGASCRWPALLQISCKEGAIVGGILLGYLVSYLVVDDVGGWRYILGTELPLALILGA